MGQLAEPGSRGRTKGVRAYISKAAAMQGLSLCYDSVAAIVGGQVNFGRTEAIKNNLFAATIYR